jgi:hypothetical protein
MQEVEQWLDHPVTEKFIEALSDRQDELVEARGEIMSDDPTELFRLSWLFQGGIMELNSVLDLGDKDTRADAIEALFGGDEDDD